MDSVLPDWQIYILAALAVYSIVISLIGIGIGIRQQNKKRRKKSEKGSLD